jgi:cytochrome P450
MSTTAAPSATLTGAARPSPAGPLSPGATEGLPAPPAVSLPRAAQILRFNQRPLAFLLAAQRRHGDLFRMHAILPGGFVVTAHPDHVQSLFTAPPELAPSLTAESPLRPIVGPNSVLTALGARHLRQRRLLLPPFHGVAIAAYEQLIAEATHREIDRWPVGEPFALAPRMQTITLDVIMAAVFGIEGRPADGTPEQRLRRATKAVLRASRWKAFQLGELMNIGRDEPMGIVAAVLGVLDRATYAVIAERRAAGASARHDILSLLLEARTEDGAQLTDRELRDELLTLVLAGHETTANQLAWTWERLVRAPGAHTALRDAVRGGDGPAAAEVVEATILESMRARPVIPLVGRRVTVRWRMGDHALPADSAVLISVMLLHHRADVYPDPYAFRPERWLGGAKPGTYTWIPFGGGIRRCLGAALAMAEQRTVIEAMARRVDLRAADPEPERAMHRNVTMIPAHGARVMVTRRR